MAAISNSAIPFIYGRPVYGDEFIDRDSDLMTILNRLKNGESTAIVGEPHIGKSSLLRQLAESCISRSYMGHKARGLSVSLLDLHPITPDYSPVSFWADALGPLSKRPGNSSTRRLLTAASETDYSHRSLERLFNHLASGQRRLVLLLDEFEQLLIHPNFKTASFFTLLRSLATTSGGLALITASRLSVTDMIKWGRGLLDVGSGFFNHMIELRLHPFDEQATEKLLERGGESLPPQDRRFARFVAGRHPFLLQAMAAALLETAGDDRYARAAEFFYGRIAFHFDELWHSMDGHTRTTAIILSLMELGGHALGRDFSYGEIEREEAFGPQLRKLAELGIAEQVDRGWQFDWDHLLLWHGQRWRLETVSFAWWVRDVAIAEMRSMPSYDEWLDKKEYRLLLTQEQWNKLVSPLKNAPDWVLRGVGGMARTLFEELLKRTK